MNGATDKVRRGPKLPFGELSGVWAELKRTYSLQKEGTLPPEDAKARVYTLSMMLGVVDRLQEQRAMDTMAAEIATLREAVSGVVVETTAQRSLPAGISHAS